MVDQKISQFTDGGKVQNTDEIATNRNGVNTKVKVGTAAAKDVGSEPNMIPVFQNDGQGHAMYPPGDGSQLTGVVSAPPDADSIPYDNASSGLSAVNVQQALDQIYAGTGGGGVESINGKAGIVTLNADEIPYDTAGSDISSATVQDALDELSNSLGTAALKDVGTGANNVVQLDGMGRLPAVNASQLTNLPPYGLSVTTNYLHVQQQRPAGTHAGASTSNTTHKRLLNTVLNNTIAGASLAVLTTPSVTSQITLPAGTYYFLGSATGINTGNSKLRLYNTSNASYIAEGMSDYTATGGGGLICPLVAVFTLSSTSVLELHHFIANGKATDGLGSASNQGNEIYADVQIWKVT